MTDRENQTADIEELLPCPCCKGPAEQKWIDSTTNHYIECNACGLRTSVHVASHGGSAKDDWNTRPALTAYLAAEPQQTVEPVGSQYRYKSPKNVWTQWGNYQPALSSYSDWQEESRSVYATPTSQADLINRPTHRHKKRGREYVLIGVGKMQSEGWRDLHEEEVAAFGSIGSGVDMREVAIYRSVDDGSLWVRPIEEFNDGRFEAISRATEAGYISNTSGEEG